jgi:flagellar basal body-associated protein FliL
MTRTSRRPADDDSTPSSSRLVTAAAAVALVIGLPIGIAIGMAAVETPWSPKSGAAAPPPEWIAMPALRATTRDGTAVRARVALDVQSSLIKATIQRNTQQVGLLLEVSVASHNREQLRSAEGIQGLSDDMRGRINDYLGGDDEAVRSVAIQDLLVKPQ